MSLRRIPSLNWLRVFEAAARTESFARAAEALAMSPPAVSQQIRALEDHLGERLFERGPRAVRLTPAGLRFLPVVAHGLRTLEGGANDIFGDRAEQRLRLLVQLIFAEAWLAPRLHEFTDAHPEIAVTLATAIDAAEVGRAGYDLGIHFAAPPGPEDEGDPLTGERLRPVARPEVAETIRGPADLLKHRLIEVATTRTGWPDILAPAREGRPEATVPRTTYVDATSVALALAAAGHGIALERSPVTDALLASHGLVPCAAIPAVESVQGYHLLYPSRARLSRPARLFRDWLLAQVTG